MSFEPHHVNACVLRASSAPRFADPPTLFSLLLAAVFCALLPRAHAQAVVTTLAGGNTSGVTPGTTDGEGTAALFTNPSFVTIGALGAAVVLDLTSRVRVIYPNRSVGTLAGGGANGTTSGFIDGAGTAALFGNPGAAALDAAGVMVVVDSDNHKLRLLHPNRTVTTLAGGNSTGNAPGSTNGVGTAALFQSPFGAAVDSSGAVYVADRSNHKVRLIYPNRSVVTIAGGNITGVTAGSSNGVGTAALFYSPYGVAVNALGLYVLDTGNNRIRLIHPNRSVVTLAGSSAGSTNGIGTAALFSFPRGFAVDAAGAVYIADAGNHKIRLMHPNRTVVTLAGGGATGTALGSNDGEGTAALFAGPRGVAVDAFGTVFVADRDNQRVRLIYPFSCPAGTSANFTARSCAPCPPGAFSSSPMAPSCSLCPGGTFATAAGSTLCDACPAGHACPPGTSSWTRLNCGRGSYCPQGSTEPLPCPLQAAPAPHASWAAHPLGSQGPAFLVETSACLLHCFWSVTSGDGVLSAC